MARVPAVELERLKRDVSVRRLAEAKGVTFTKSGDDNWLGLCPFHDDKTPSLVVSEKKNLWHCLGACRAGGGPIDFIMKAEGVAFRHAVELLRESVDLRPKRSSSPRRLPSPLDVNADDATLLRQTVDFYHQQFKVSPEALDYLDSRGLKSDALIDTFRLGFANRTLGLRLPEADKLEGGKIRRHLQALGVYREAGHEHLSGCLVIPIHDEAGAVVGMYGRKVTSNPKPHIPTHLYLPGPHQAAFNSAALAGYSSAILCESILDALTFWAAGFRNVTAAYGVDGFTPHHLEALKRHAIRHVLIAFDRDDAGDTAAEALAKRLQTEGFECYRVQFPRGMDANEYAAKVRPAAKSLGVALRNAAFMGEGLPKGIPDFSSLVASPAPRDAGAPSLAVPVGLEGGKRVAPTTALKVATLVAPATPVPEALHTSVVVPTTAASTAAERVVSTTSAAVVITPNTPTAASTTEREVNTPAEPTAPETDNDDEVTFAFGPRRFRLRGLAKAHGSETLRLNVLLAIGERFHVDTFDLYSAKSRLSFIQHAALECGLEPDAVKRDVGHLLLQLEALLDKRRADKAGPKLTPLSEAEKEEALALLRTPDLLQRVLTDFNRCGVVGEETNKLVGYLATVSRKLEDPLAILIQSSSAAGKSSLMDAVLAFVPEEDKTQYSAMTGQALFYMGDADLKHKVLAIAEEEGASRASYALKLLQSEGELNIASTGKNPQTGKLETHTYHVEGPAQLFLTTTATQLDEELLNRCLVLTVDENRTQTSAIHQLQREKRTLEGRMVSRERDSVLKLHQDAQRLLRPLVVVNPYARELSFPDARTRARRDFPKYLTLIDAIALLHQYQRPVKTAQKGPHLVEYIEVTPADIAAANRLAAAVLARSLDELPPQTRNLLHQLKDFVAKRATQTKQLPSEVRFTRREVREVLALRHSQVALHLARLVEFEYLVVRRDAHGTHVYLLRDIDEVETPALTAIPPVAGASFRAETPDSGPSPVSFRSASATNSLNNTEDLPTEEARFRVFPPPQLPEPPEVSS